MKQLVLITFVFLFLVSWTKKDAYSDISSESETIITKQIAELKKQKTSDARALRAVFIMKSAQFEFAPWSKFSVFNEGKAMLEKEIKADYSNPEYRLLRLIIQENAPAIVGYSSSVEADAKLIKSSLAKMDTDAKAFALKYAKKSEALKGLK
jgi:hypothetical protein